MEDKLSKRETMLITLSLLTLAFSGFMLFLSV